MGKLPSLRRHKPTSQAVVTLSGKDHYLGVWPAGRKTAPPAIQLAYERLVAEWLASNRQPLPPRSAAGTWPNSIPMSSDLPGEEALPPPVAAMVELQLLTGARPQEVMTLRPADVHDRGTGVWHYVPRAHKTEHHGRGRVVVL